MLSAGERAAVVAETKVMIANFRVRYHLPKTHAGTLIQRELPTEGRRASGRADFKEDDSFFHSHYLEDILEGWDTEEKK